MILNLKQTSGLDLKLDTGKCQLSFGKGLRAPLPAIRNIREMREVLLDKGINEPQDLYYMYRDLHLAKDADLLEKNKLRYDVTAIKPNRLGKELMKTAGHYHPGIFGELYEVLEGEALCLLQKPDAADYHIIEDVILVRACAAEKIVIPPGYGHILVNPGPGCLVTSNWVSSRFSSEYQLYKTAKGAAYFIVDAGSAGKIEFIRNAFFKKLPPVRSARPAKKIERFGLSENSPIYPIITRDAVKLEFLNYPDKYEYGDIFDFREAEGS